jgi:hypothetical protein
MIALILLLIGLIIGGFFAYPCKTNRALFYERYLLCVSFFSIAIIGILFGFIPHVFFADSTAVKIGWPTGSPFQFEVGIHDGCWGVLALLSFWFRGSFLLATCIGWSLFLIGAGYGHLRDTLLHSNYAPYNVQFIAGDFIPAIVLLILAYLFYKNNSINL